MKYNILVNILDKLSTEAPAKYSSYKLTKDTEKDNQIRAKCLIHLFLMVRFGISDFEEREKNITDGSFDGGIDAYYINKESKVIYLIQSKFRATAENFESKEIDLEEIVKMDLGRILQGNETDEAGNKYSGKIKQLQRDYSNLTELGLYEKKVIFLCNLIRYTDERIKRLIENFKYEIFNYEKTYNKLVFPLLTSTYYDVDSLDIIINLEKKEIPHLRQEIETEVGKFDITVVFVPIYEVARIMSKYKNALLIHNPRNYLSLDKNPVNKKIRESVVNISTGEFALFNNGLTIFADSGNVNTSTGRQSRGTVTIKKPQIINGGQTAFTLSKLYEENIEYEKFEGKEVMLKIISPIYELNESNPLEKNKDKIIIDKISRATNQQSEIEEADMRANEEIQIEIQKLFFEKYGLLYERKKGEFEEAINKKMVDRKYLVSREDLIKSYISFKGNPGKAKNIKKNMLFEEESFNIIFNDVNIIDELYLSIDIYNKITVLEKENKKNFEEKFEQYGHALKYGKNALIYMYSLVFDKEIVDQHISNNISLLLNNWKDFEDYFYKDNGNTIFNEYRNTTIDDHILNYSEEMKKNIINS